MTDRLERGQEIADKPNQVVRIDEKSYKVKSQSSDNEYEILKAEAGWICSCADHMYRGVTCKHIYSVEISQQIRQQVQQVMLFIYVTNIGLAIQIGLSLRGVEFFFTVYTALTQLAKRLKLHYL